MKTKILMLLITAAIVLCSCSPKKEICSVDSCSQEVYKDGLCADHYVSATLSESNSDESSAEDIDPVVAALQEQYQEYVDEAISLCRDSLKNPKSLDITRSTAGPSQVPLKNCWTSSSFRAGRTSKWVSALHGLICLAQVPAVKHRAAVRQVHQNRPKQKAAPGGGYAPSAALSSVAPKRFVLSVRTAWNYL